MAKVDIANKALLFLGEDTITSFNDESISAQTMNVFFDSCAKHLLASHNWVFARQRATLTQVGGHSDPVYEYAYQLPSNCLKVICADGDDVVWRRYKDQLWTNVTSITVEYIENVDTSLYSPGFEKALQYYLAAEVSRSICESSTKRQEALEAYTQAIVEAIESNDLEVGHEEFDEYPGEYIRRFNHGGFTRAKG